MCSSALRHVQSWAWKDRKFFDSRSKASKTHSQHAKNILSRIKVQIKISIEEPDSMSQSTSNSVGKVEWMCLGQGQDYNVLWDPVLTVKGEAKDPERYWANQMRSKPSNVGHHVKGPAIVEMRCINLQCKTSSQCRRSPGLITQIQTEAVRLWSSGTWVEQSSCQASFVEPRQMQSSASSASSWMGRFGTSERRIPKWMPRTV